MLELFSYMVTLPNKNQPSGARLTAAALGFGLGLFVFVPVSWRLVTSLSPLRTKLA
jgi:hypothetical protein